MGIRVTISSVEESDHTEYVLNLTLDGTHIWQIKKRYSAFHNLYSQLANDCSGLNNVFPPKKLGKLNPEQAERRKVILEAWLREILDTILTVQSRKLLSEFLEVPAEASSPGLASLIPPPPPSSSSSTMSPPSQQEKDHHAVTGGEGIVSSATVSNSTSPAPTWSDAFMTSDPLALLCVEEEQRPTEKSKNPPSNGKPSSSSTAPPSSDQQQQSKVTSTTSSSPAKPAVVRPAQASNTIFMSSSSKKPEDYPLTGDGLRNAIMAKDTKAVHYLLSKDPSLASYRDKQADTMLHLAGIFQLTEISLALVEAGPDLLEEWPVNSRNELIVDVMPPTLKNKVLEAFKKKKEKGGATPSSSSTA